MTQATADTPIHVALELLSERMNAFNGLWGYYITSVVAAAGALIAYRQQLPGVWGCLIAIGFAAFAFANLSGLTAILDQRWVLYKAFERHLHDNNFPPTAFKPSRHGEVVALHLVGTSTVVFLALYFAVFAESACSIAVAAASLS